MPLFKGKWDVSEDLLHELRSRFLEEVDSSPEEAEKYHPDDVERVRKNDWYIARYLLHMERDVDLALKMMKESLKFRNEFEINTLKKEDFPKEYFEAGTLQLYNKDVRDHPVVVIRGKAHIKNSEMRRLHQQYFLYWVEKGVQASDWGVVCILFDLTDSSYKNLDIEMMRFMLTVFKQYYPWGLSYFLVYNLPWFLSAFWKLIKQWIPEKHLGRIVFVDANSIQKYISEDQLPICMGGTCTDPYEPKSVEESSLGWL